MIIFMWPFSNKKTESKSAGSVARALESLAGIRCVHSL